MKFEDHVESFFNLFRYLDNPENRKIVEEVNRRIDQFAHFPNWETLEVHRRYLHHQEGVEYFRAHYGPIGQMAAEQHILDDGCYPIPNAIDYYTNKCDCFGRPIQ